MVNAHGHFLRIHTPITLAAGSNIECRTFPGVFEIHHKFVIAAAVKSQFEEPEYLTQRDPDLEYQEIIERRHALRIEPFKSLAEVGFDGPWVTPYQITSKSPDGPVLIALHWLDESSILREQATLQHLGYLPTIRFNNVINTARARQGLSRPDIYVTQTFHLIPRTRSERISQAAITRSFDEVTRFELQGRKVIALGEIAAGECARHHIEHMAVCLPSRRGYSNEKNATEIADAIAALVSGEPLRTLSYETTANSTRIMGDYGMNDRF
jgi:hypothetical protein